MDVFCRAGVFFDNSLRQLKSVIDESGDVWCLIFLLLKANFFCEFLLKLVQILKIDLWALCDEDIERRNDSLLDLILFSFSL